MAEAGPRSERLAVVTGGNKGVGYFAAQQLLGAGLQVVIACRSEALAKEAAARLGCEYELLDISHSPSIEAFAKTLESKYGRLDVLVNNAAIAFKASDPTPFAGQTGPTLKTNFFGTAELTDRLLPLLRASAASGGQPRLVNVASMAGALRQVSPQLQQQFSSPALDRAGLDALVRKFAADVRAGRHKQEGWGNSNYGFSKLAVIAYTKLVAREEGTGMRVNACCPGYCKTDMSNNRGGQSPEVGARNAVLLALLPDSGPSGAFFQNEANSAW
ncbi:unnamed protein product [Polarella glacialis]|uniref:Uncharacterized protein n=1 Tax=Polarella glacialis TaxID=89957 RepID=A0A813JHA5_POLGL|nr:unnamed protein product [Polarella glacialis]CAE8677338.1 unnamed protein product [Polarella glacialis]